MKNLFYVAHSLLGPFDRKEGNVFCLSLSLSHYFLVVVNFAIENAFQKYFKMLNKVECLSLKMFPGERMLTGSLLTLKMFICPYNPLPRQLKYSNYT